MKWISVKERLPKFSKEMSPKSPNHVLVYDGSSYCVAYLYKENYLGTSEPEFIWRDSHDGCEMKVTHWMPLPQPPEENYK